ncbi:MAG: PD40 domain-containing protein [Planctomycetes bacterium]|nr:PD40 domain-containing protein [Planctomycetota bacterium]
MTFDPADDDFPVWSPSGESVVFGSKRDGFVNLYWKRSDGSGETQRLPESPNWQIPQSWRPDGRHLATFEGTAKDGANLRILKLRGDDLTGWTAGDLSLV